MDGIYEDMRITMTEELKKIFRKKEDDTEYDKQSGEWLMHKIQLEANDRITEVIKFEKT